jgi:hypothetical protein
MDLIEGVQLPSFKRPRRWELKLKVLGGVTALLLAAEVHNGGASKLLRALKR